MANQAMLLNPTRTRPCPLLLPPPSRIACSSWVGFTPRTDLFHCVSITHHRHQPLQTTTTTQQKQPFSKNKQTKLYGSLTPPTPDDNEEYSTKQEEESQTQNKEEFDHESRKWRSIKKVYFVLATQYLFYGLSCATFAINPLIRAFFHQTLDGIMAVVNLCMIALMLIPKMKPLKPIFYVLFSVTGIFVTGLGLADKEKGIVVLLASILTLVTVSAITKLLFEDYSKKRMELHPNPPFFSCFCFSVGCLLYCFYVVFIKKWETTLVTAIVGITGSIGALICGTQVLLDLSEDDGDNYTETCFVIHLTIIYLFSMILEAIQILT